MKALNSPGLKMIKRIFIISGIAIIIGLAGIYLGLRIWIKSDIDKFCTHAMNQYKVDRVEALIAVLESETHGLKEKNDAIWTLEYIGDERALPVLNRLLTGKECNHNTFVCQRELNRAINQIEGKRFSMMRFK